MLDVESPVTCGCTGLEKGVELSRQWMNVPSEEDPKRFEGMYEVVVGRAGRISQRGDPSRKIADEIECIVGG